MNRTEEERQRIQRMLARAQQDEKEHAGPASAPRTPPAAPPGQRQPPPRTAAENEGRPHTARQAATAPRPAPARPGPATGARRPAGTARPLSPILRRRRRRKWLVLAALVLAVLLAMAALSGALGTAVRAVRDGAEDLSLYLDRDGGGWPADTGIQEPLQAQPLAGGAVVMDSEDVVIYSAYGGLIRTIQPGYARPSLAMGGTRFALYNRSGTEVQVEGRTDTVYTHSFDSGVMLCAMSANGSLAAATRSERYAAVLEVLDPDERTVITYSLAQADGVPVALAFAADNRRLATGTISAAGGQVRSTVYLMDTGKEELGPSYTADAGSLMLRLDWLGSDRVLAAFDTYLAVLDAATGAELARYSYDGAVLKGMSVTGRQAALLLASRSGNTLAVVGDDLRVLAAVPADDAVSVATTATDVYLLGIRAVRCYGYDGAFRWQQTLQSEPRAVLDARRPLLLAGGVLQLLKADP